MCKEILPKGAVISSNCYKAWNIQKLITLKMFDHFTEISQNSPQSKSLLYNQTQFKDNI